MPILGDINLLTSSPHENIDPEDVDAKIGLAFNRQIESMQIGRVSKKQ
jgi:hypothetical protein